MSIFRARTVFFLLLCLGLNFELKAQIPDGSYVAGKVTYLTDEALPDDNIVKHSYVKYTFKNPGEVNISNVYFEKGSSFLYSVIGDRLQIKSTVGALMNTLKILESSPVSLVLINAGPSGAFDDPYAIKYTLYNEELIQRKLPLSPDDIYSVHGVDTVFKSGQKVYAKFNGPSFQQYIYNSFSKAGISIRSGELLSSFIINENGTPDSLKIIQGFSPKYDAAYVKFFNTAKKMWIPAFHNGKNVKVLMNQHLKYSSSDNGFLEAFMYAGKGNAAYLEKDYELALYYFDMSLDLSSDVFEVLYKRGICRQHLGNIKGACQDWMRVKALGRNIADEVLQKYCR